VGNLHLRFDEGRAGRAIWRRPLSYSTGSETACELDAAFPSRARSKRFLGFSAAS